MNIRVAPRQDNQRIGDLQKAQQQDEFSRGLRALLMRPLMAAGHEDFSAVRRQAERLRDWFARETGWPLHVDREGARLFKRPANLSDDTRGIPSYDKRRYVLLCLACAVLERADPQITLQLLGERVMQWASEATLQSRGFEFTLRTAADRRDLVAVCRTLLEYGVLQRVAGEEEGFIHDGNGTQHDALYDVQRRMLAGMLAAVRGPSTWRSEDAPTRFEDRLRSMVVEHQVESEQGRRDTLRHHLARRLLDDPVPIPAAGALRPTTNRDGLRALLASWVGMSDYLHEPPPGQTRDPLAASISHALTFCFQSQTEIAQRKHLFHGSSDRFVAQAIKDTLPYFLGAVTDDYVAQQQELKRVRTEIRQIERKLAEAAAIRGEGLGRADTLLAEAKAVGLSELEDSAPWQEKIEALRTIQNTPVPSAASEAGEDVEFRRLSDVRSELVREQRTLQSTLERARSFEGSSRGYAAEAREHTARLQAVTVFEHDAPGHACPLCLQYLPEASQAPSIGDLRAAQNYIGERSGAMDSATPRIATAIQEVETKLADVRRRLDDNRTLLTAVKRGNQRLQLATDVEARRAMVLGRISLYMENIPQMPDLSEHQTRLVGLREQEAQLDEAVSTDTIQVKLESCLSNVNKHLSNYAKQIDLEYSDSPLRLDPRNLTVVADTPERPVPMREIGSGENHVGYHIVAHLALHTWFASRTRTSAFNTSSTEPGPESGSDGRTHATSGQLLR